MRSAWKYFLFAIFLIVVDQAIKLWMHYVVIPDYFGEIDIIPGFFKLHYITNRGMAFGLELGGDYGKLVLTVFRVIAMGVISYFLVKLSKRNYPQGFLWSLAAILAGAIGNVIDSIFYGVFLNNAPFDAPSPWFHGQVIDMFYAYGLDGYWPDWVPVLGGTYNNTPIFNFADACIFCGVVVILVFQKTFIEKEVAASGQKNDTDYDTVIDTTNNYDEEEN
ncbi:lipoprotein signal peptidase [Marinilongibacter aquaticus]|uniref:lipoprotein signal peptidase n=1 Tax=Marinilongibacter aquaticus TaxID=2975157 RepID=UPI0021BDD0A0|nr:lipoprotein signal peptidase [Marinilongibacter aquaticus]UBM59168.1 lipoprotein signal peptidase [Marinilongibacter aquaticus]